MGKVRIIESLGDGLYQVQRQYNDTRFQERKAKLEADITRLNDEIAAFFVAVSELESLEQQDRDEYLAAVDSYAAVLKAGGDVPSARSAMEQAYRDLLDRQQALMITKANQAKAKAARIEARNTLETITAWEDPAPEQAWCADLSEDVSGDLASIEVPGEPKHPLIVYPQARGEGAHAPAKHGELMPRQWMTAPQAFFNAAILPGWQRHKPLWRLATIDSIAGDTATVTLDIEESTAQQLPVNEPFIIEGVPIEYMDCNGQAFAEGDRVVVELQGQDWKQPRVIGFESNPAPCEQLFVSLSLGGGFDPLYVMMAKISAKDQAVAARWFHDLGKGPDSEFSMHSINGLPCQSISDDTFSVSEGRICHDGETMAPTEDVFYLHRFGSSRLVAIDSQTQLKVALFHPDSLDIDGEYSPELVDGDCSYIYAVAGDGDRVAVAGYDGCNGHYFIKAFDSGTWGNEATATFDSAEYIESVGSAGGYVVSVRWAQTDGDAYLALHDISDMSLIHEITVSIYTLGVAISGNRVIVQREHWASESAADGGCTVYNIMPNEVGDMTLQWAFDLWPFSDWIDTYDDGDRSASGSASG